MNINAENKTPETAGQSSESSPTPPANAARKKGRKGIVVGTIVVTTIAGGALAARAADYGGLVNLISPVVSQYTGQDISKYASYLSTFSNVLSSVQSGDYVSAASSIGYSLGDAGIPIPTKLTEQVNKSVDSRYASGKIGGTYGISKAMSQTHEQNTAENTAHRAYVESVLGSEGQSHIKKSIEADSSLATSASDLATSSSKSKISQEILKNISSQLAIDTVANAQLHSELVQMRVGQAQQTEILSGIKETSDENERSKDIAQLAQVSANEGSSGILAGLASRSDSSSSHSASSESASAKSLISTK